MIDHENIIATDECIAPEMMRVIGDVGPKDKGPLVVFVAGIHGNEPAGVQALEQLLKQISQHRTILQGRVLALKGNTNALHRKVRYIHNDLNRLWTNDNIARLPMDGNDSSELQEMHQILSLLEEAIAHASGRPIYFFDLHTTSGRSRPFLTINDAMINSKFAENFNDPTILGIEESLDGAFLSYINQLGYVAVGYEGGQHTDPTSVEHCLSFAKKCLKITGIVDYIPVTNRATAPRSQARFYEISGIHRINPEVGFKMKAGFESFQRVQKGAHVAQQQNQEIFFPMKGYIFLPLYQAQGSEGFFIIRRIPSGIIAFSRLLRRYRLYKILQYLPGVLWLEKDKGMLSLDQSIARWMAVELLHLLGYRLLKKSTKHIVVQNRELIAKTKLYKECQWW